MRRLARVLAYGLVVAAALFGALELACRWGVIPNADHDRVARARAPAPHGRLLILGDSFSVEDPTSALSRTLGNQLRERFTARGVAVVNLAVSGYGPADELDALDLFTADASDFRPDVVLVDYFAGNDVTDTISRMQGAPSRVGLLRYRNGRRLQRSYLLRFVLDWVQKRQVRSLAQKIRRTQMQSLLPIEWLLPAVAAREAVNPFLVDAAHFHPSFFEDNLLVESAAARRAWDANERIFRRIRDYAASRGARLVIAIFPHTLQVNDSHVQFLKDLGFTIDDRMLNSTVPQDRLKAFCQREHVTCIDLLPEMRRANEELYLPNDDHWITPGHTLAAKIIDEQLASLFH